MCVYRLHNVVGRPASQLLDIVTGDAKIIKSSSKLVTELVEGYVLTGLLHELSEVTINGLIAHIHYKISRFLVRNFLYQVIYVRWKQVCMSALVGLVTVSIMYI